MYKITIEKIETKNILKESDWVVLEKRPYLKEELKEAQYGVNFEKDLKSIYGYAPRQESTKEFTTLILEQSVDNFNLVEVIKAINNIKD